MTTSFKTLDSGQRTCYSTGAVRDLATGKGRYDLLPAVAIRRVADVYERGAVKYTDRNWEKGIPVSRFLDSALRHTFQFLEGRLDEDHLGQAIFNLLGAIETIHKVQTGELPDDLLNNLPANLQRSLKAQGTTGVLAEGDLCSGAVPGDPSERPAGPTGNP